MSESKHTPGPWFARGRYIGTKNHMSFVGECRDVNGNWTDAAPASANACLIAAAPDLLDALREVMEWIGNWSPNFAEDDEWPDTESRARAAIAKAGGRS